MQEQIAQNTSEISFPDIILKLQLLHRYIMSKWLLILIIATVGGIAGVTYAWLQKPKYVAILSFSMEDDKQSSGGLAGIASQFGLDLGGVGGTFSGENILAFMHSDKMIQSTLLSTTTIGGKPKSLLNMYLDVYELDKGFKKSKEKSMRELSFPENQDIATYTRLQDSILIKITEDIRKQIIQTIKPDSKLNLYTVTCTSQDETFSSEFCNKLVTQVSNFYMQTKTKRSAKIVDILQKRVDSIRTAYDNALAGRAELSDENLNAAFQTPLVGIQRKQTDVTVLATAYGEVLKNLEIAKFNLLKDAPLIQVIDTPMLPLEKKKLGRLLGGVVAGALCAFLFIIYLIIKRMFKQTI